MRRARTLNNWRKYRDAGVNISIGSYTYPRNMVMNMQTASYLGKIMDHVYFLATAADVSVAATAACATNW